LFEQKSFETRELFDLFVSGTELVAFAVASR
jgi:hypothetical protein